MLLMEIRAKLELARESDDAVFSKGRPDNLHADRKPIYKSARNSDCRQTTEVGRLYKPGCDAALLRTLAGLIVERLIRAVSHVEARWCNQQVKVGKQLPECCLNLRADPHRFQVIERRVAHSGLQPDGLARVGETIYLSTSDQDLENRGAFRVDYGAA